MRIRVLFSKGWQAVSMLYHLFLPPYSTLRDHHLSASFFLFSRNFHYIYKLLKELNKLKGSEKERFFWEFSPLGSEKHKFRNLVKKIRVYGWREIKKVLEKRKEELEEYFNENVEKVKEIIMKVFLISDFPKEFYVFLSYEYSGNGGSAMFEGYPAILLSTNEEIDKKDDLDTFVHEFLHWIFNKSGLTKIFREVLEKEKSKFGEAFFDYFCPFGHISKKLGLVEEINWERKRKGRRYEWYKEWFEKLKILENYDFSEDVWNFLEKNSKDLKIKEVCKRIKDILSTSSSKNQ